MALHTIDAINRDETRPGTLDITLWGERHVIPVTLYMSAAYRTRPATRALDSDLTVIDLMGLTSTTPVFRHRDGTSAPLTNPRYPSRLLPIYEAYPDDPPPAFTLSIVDATGTSTLLRRLPLRLDPISLLSTGSTTGSNPIIGWANGPGFDTLAPAPAPIASGVYALKYLRRQAPDHAGLDAWSAVSPLTQGTYRWDLPTATGPDAGPGAWSAWTYGELGFCGNGFHAVTIDQLTSWTAYASHGSAIYLVELDAAGDLVTTYDKVVTNRIRLVAYLPRLGPRVVRYLNDHTTAPWRQQDRYRDGFSFAELAKRGVDDDKIAALGRDRHHLADLFARAQATLAPTSRNQE